MMDDTILSYSGKADESCQAVCSQFADRLEQVNLDRLLKAIKASSARGEFGVGKPDQRVYLHALDQLKVQPEETWMVGDNLEWEVVIPQQLGIFAIWLDTLGKGLPENSSIHPDRVIRDLPELLT